MNDDTREGLDAIYNYVLDMSIIDISKLKKSGVSNKDIISLIKPSIELFGHIKTIRKALEDRTPTEVDAEALENNFWSYHYDLRITQPMSNIGLITCFINFLVKTGILRVRE